MLSGNRKNVDDTSLYKCWLLKQLHDLIHTNWYPVQLWMSKGVRIWDLEGSKWETNVWSGHLFLPNNTNPIWNRPHQQYYRVPVNKELLTGTRSLSIRNYWQGQSLSIANYWQGGSLSIRSYWQGQGRSLLITPSINETKSFILKIIWNDNNSYYINSPNLTPQSLVINHMHCQHLLIQ